MDQLEQKIGYRFRNKKLLRQALTAPTPMKKSSESWAATRDLSFWETLFWS